MKLASGSISILLALPRMRALSVLGSVGRWGRFVFEAQVRGQSPPLHVVRLIGAVMLEVGTGIAQRQPTVVKHGLSAKSGGTAA
jgi:hypothetical protein